MGIVNLQHKTNCDCVKWPSTKTQHGCEVRFCTCGEYQKHIEQAINRNR